LRALKRRGVVESHREPADGSFVVRLAAVPALWEAPRRTRARGSAIQPANPASLDALDADTLALLRQLAQRSLETLGVADEPGFLTREMLRHLSAVADSIGTGASRDVKLRAALEAALAQSD